MEHVTQAAVPAHFQFRVEEDPSFEIGHTEHSRNAYIKELKDRLQRIFQQRGGREPLGGALALTVKFVVPIPRCWRQSFLEGAQYSPSGPSTLNVNERTQLVVEAFRRGGVISQTSQVVELSAGKRFGDQGYYEIDIQKIAS